MLYRAEKQPGGGPAILLIHGGAGLDGHAREQAQRWAALGYTVLACDMYGDEVVGDRDRIMCCLRELSADPAALALARSGQAIEDVVAFTHEMEDAGADWRLTMYGGAAHGFTHRHAQPGAIPGVAYEERADRRSFEDVSRFLIEAFDSEGS